MIPPSHLTRVKPLPPDPPAPRFVRSGCELCHRAFWLGVALGCAALLLFGGGWAS